MELTPSGFYKTPRIIKGLDFLIHIHDVLDCGNEMYVKFNKNGLAERVMSYTRLYDIDHENSVLFDIGGELPKKTLIQDISQFEFIQYRPQKEWVAIHMGNTKRIDINQFEELFISDTFRHLKPIIFLFDSRFWYVMGLELCNDADGPFWAIYLKRQESDFMTQVKVPILQKFILNPQSNSWSLDDPTEEITDLEQIKNSLRWDEVNEVIVSGVPMNLVRIQEIAKGVLFFIFVDEQDRKRYYYSRRTTKLRIITDARTGKKEHRLDHIKAMHID